MKTYGHIYIYIQLIICSIIYSNLSSAHYIQDEYKRRKISTPSVLTACKFMNDEACIERPIRLPSLQLLVWNRLCVVVRFMLRCLLRLTLQVSSKEEMTK